MSKSKGECVMKQSPGRRPGIINLGARGIFVSLRQFLLETGKDRPSVVKRLQRAGIEPTKSKNGVLLYRLRDLLAVAVYRTDDKGRIAIGRLAPMHRKA